MKFAYFGTIEQFKRHLTDDVLPPLLDKLSKTARESAEGEAAAVPKPLDKLDRAVAQLPFALPICCPKS
jgi:hypothetical protein